MTLAGVVPLAGLAVSHAPPLDLLTVNPTAEPVLVRTERVCEEDVVLPCCRLKLRVVGLTVRVAVAAVTLKVTDTVRTISVFGTAIRTVPV